MRASETIRKVVLVEANALIGLELADLLSIDGGYDVCAVATSAQDALSAIEEHQPDLVLADLRVILSEDLPVDAIRGPDHKVILITGDEPAAAEHVSDGTPCLLKPFSGPTLLAEINKVLGDFQPVLIRAN